MKYISIFSCIIECFSVSNYLYSLTLLSTKIDFGKNCNLEILQKKINERNSFQITKKKSQISSGHENQHISKNNVVIFHWIVPTGDYIEITRIPYITRTLAQISNAHLSKCKLNQYSKSLMYGACSCFIHNSHITQKCRLHHQPGANQAVSYTFIFSERLKNTPVNKMVWFKQ